MYFAVFAFGAVIGSFLNVVHFRKNTGESALKGRSRCFSCGKKLSWFELIPILSFVIQRGRCRPPLDGCGSKISREYPVVEFITALLAVAVYSNLLGEVGNFHFLFYFAAFCTLLLIAIYDFKHKIIERHFLYIFGGFAIIVFAFQYLNISTFISALAIFSFFYLLWKLSHGRWMGRGDADLAFFLALFLGYPLSLFMLLGSFWIGSSVGIILLLFGKRKITMKSEIPFGPFLVLSSFFAWYLKDILIFIYGLLYF